jgi:AraC family transcriptional regulator
MHTAPAIIYPTFKTSRRPPSLGGCKMEHRPRLSRCGLYQEEAWRQPWVENNRCGDHFNILASRWTDERTTVRREQSTCLVDRYIMSVALRPARLRLVRTGVPMFDGVMPVGTVHVTEPGQLIEAEFSTPCDFIHFHVTGPFFRDRLAAAAKGSVSHDPQEVLATHSVLDLLVRDDVAGKLSHTLTQEPNGADPFYAESVGRTILTRVLAQWPAVWRVGALPIWRLRRVQNYVATCLTKRISLAELASASGLSRMHFAAQFRVATGCSPHDYLLQHRVDCARRLLTDTDAPLAEVALSVGFQTQSHFTTVFKRFVGDTPAYWRRTHRVVSTSQGTRA